jgi:hypothetical protein
MLKSYAAVLNCMGKIKMKFTDTAYTSSYIMSGQVVEYSYFPEDTIYAILFKELVSTNL